MVSARRCLSAHPFVDVPQQTVRHTSVGARNGNVPGPRPVLTFLLNPARNFDIDTSDDPWGPVRDLVRASYPSSRMHLVRDGVSIEYETHGDPDDCPVILLHGLGADRRMWDPQIRRYPREGYFLVVPDIRGHGESSPVSEFRIADCATDVAGLLDELDLEEAVVVGVSMGGIVAQQFAISRPDRVRGLVLADTFSGVRGPIARLNARAADVGLSLLPGMWQWKIVESHFDAPEEEAIREYFRTMLFETDPEQLKQARRAINRFDCVDDLDGVTVPTLVLVGKQNGKWFVNLSRTTADEIDGARFEILPNGRDPSNLSATDEFDSVTLEFLGSIQDADTESPSEGSSVWGRSFRTPSLWPVDGHDRQTVRSEETCQGLVGASTG